VTVARPLPPAAPALDALGAGPVPTPGGRAAPADDPLAALWPSAREESSPAALQAEIARLRAVIDELRGRGAALPSEATSAPPPPSLGRYPERSEVFRLLASRGFDEDLAVELIQDALRHGAGGRPGDLLAEVRALLQKRLRAGACPWRPRGAIEPSAAAGPQILALVGPTGVGKTTTVAKIAARALLEGGLRVGLVTIDTYRLGASDQLLRYGRIMGVRTHVAGTDAALAEAVAACRDLDLVLVDTAGRSDPEARRQQGDLLRRVPGIQIHLVLSAATGARELAAAARQYEPLAPQAFIFSKLDEAVGPGSIVSATAALARPISCITDGQRVPEDIHAVSSRDMVKRILGRPA
jgi:flagellar biosynthesis protein FlhF